MDGALPKAYDGMDVDKPRAADAFAAMDEEMVWELVWDPSDENPAELSDAFVAGAHQEFLRQRAELDQADGQGAEATQRDAWQAVETTVSDVLAVISKIEELGVSVSALNDLRAKAKEVQDTLQSPVGPDRGRLVESFDVLAAHAGALAATMRTAHEFAEWGGGSETPRQRLLTWSAVAQDAKWIYDSVAWLLQRSLGEPAGPPTSFPDITWADQAWPDSLEKLLMTLEGRSGRKTVGATLPRAAAGDFEPYLFQASLDFSRVLRSLTPEAKAPALDELGRQLGDFLVSELRATELRASWWSASRRALEAGQVMQSVIDASVRTCPDPLRASDFLATEQSSVADVLAVFRQLKGVADAYVAALTSCGDIGENLHRAILARAQTHATAPPARGSADTSLTTVSDPARSAPPSAKGMTSRQPGRSWMGSSRAS
jgi:hypothetical protein